MSPYSRSASGARRTTNHESSGSQKLFFSRSPSRRDPDIISSCTSSMQGSFIFLHRAVGDNRRVPSLTKCTVRQCKPSRNWCTLWSANSGELFVSCQHSLRSCSPHARSLNATCPRRLLCQQAPRPRIWSQTWAGDHARDHALAQYMPLVSSSLLLC